jgi:hypothetical protein
MDKSYNDYFNHILKQFLIELISYFPYVKELIMSNYRTLLEGNDSKSDLYVKYYMSKVNDYLTEIATKDPRLFENVNLLLIEGVDFNKVWFSPDANDKNKFAIWKYLQLLTLLGRNIIPNKEYIVDMMNKVGGTIQTPDKMDKTLMKDDDVDATEEPEGIMGMMNMAGKLTNLIGGKKGGSGEGGGLGDLLGSLGGMGGGGGGGGGLGDLLGSLGGAGGIGDLLGETMKNFNFADMAKNIAEGAKEGEMEESDNNLDTNDTNTENTGNIFADMAKEMQNTFDIGDESQYVGTDGKPDIGKAMSKLMTGENNKKMMKMVGKFSKQLRQNMGNGSLNQEDLLKQTTKMMENSGTNMSQMNEIAENMLKNNKGAQNRMNNHMKSQNARDRLRKKLEDRKNIEQ